MPVNSQAEKKSEQRDIYRTPLLTELQHNIHTGLLYNTEVVTFFKTMSESKELIGLIEKKQVVTSCTK